MLENHEKQQMFSELYLIKFGVWIVVLKLSILTGVEYIERAYFLASGNCRVEMATLISYHMTGKMAEQVSSLTK